MDRCMKDYRFCSSDNAGDLNQEVTALMNNGWELYGAPILNSVWIKDKDGKDRLSHTFAQALCSIPE
jgi:hypothetical protein